MALIEEGFEGLTPTANAPARPAPFSGFLQIGAVSAFEFASGLILTAPVPNTDLASGLVLVGDFDLGGADTTWDLADNGVIDGPEDVEGSAYLGHNDDFNGAVAFGFDTEVFGFAVSATGAVNGDFRPGIGLAAYDKSGKLMSGAYMKSVPIANLGEEVLFVASSKPISKVVVTGSFLVVDLVLFDTEKGKIVKGTSGRDTLGKGNSKDADVIFGKNGNDKLFGGEFGATLYGGKGNDKLRGGDNDDMLAGEKGKDKLTGNGGQDTFLVARDAIDVVKDFNPGDDTIMLRQSEFGVLAPGSLTISQFNDGSTPVTANTRILYDKASGEISYDTDGSGAAVAQKFLKISPGLTLTSDDFFIG